MWFPSDWAVMLITSLRLITVPTADSTSKKQLFESKEDNSAQWCQPPPPLTFYTFLSVSFFPSAGSVGGIVGARSQVEEPIYLELLPSIESYKEAGG